MAAPDAECRVVVEMEGKDDANIPLALTPATTVGELKAALWKQLALAEPVGEWVWRLRGRVLSVDNDGATVQDIGGVSPGDRVSVEIPRRRVEREKLRADGITEANVESILETAIADRDFRTLQRAVSAELPSLPFLHDLLLTAAADNSIDVVAVLIEFEYISPNGLQAKAEIKDIPAAVAAERGHLGVLQLLLESGADPNHLDAREMSPLMRAAASGELECIDCLLNSGAWVGYRSTRGISALCLAAQAGHDKVVEHLVKHGAETDVSDFWSRMSPLHHAVDNGDSKSVELLAQRRGSLNSRNRAGQSPLIMAALNDDINTAKVLLKHKADVEVKDNEGRSALFHATAEGNIALVRHLVEECNADVHAASNFGMTPLLVAEEGDNDEVLRYLQGAAGEEEEEEEGGEA